MGRGRRSSKGQGGGWWRSRRGPAAGLVVPPSDPRSVEDHLDYLCARFGIDRSLDDRVILDLGMRCIVVVQYRLAKAEQNDDSTALAAIDSVPEEFATRLAARDQEGALAGLIARERELGHGEAEALSTSELQERSQLRVRSRLHNLLLEAALANGHQDPSLLTTADLLAYLDEREPGCFNSQLQAAFDGEQVTREHLEDLHQSEKELRRLLGDGWIQPYSDLL